MDPDLSCLYYIILKPSLKAVGGLNTVTIFSQHLMSKNPVLSQSSHFISQRNSFELIAIEVLSSRSYFLCSFKELVKACCKSSHEV